MADVTVLINDEELVLDKSGDIVGTYAINKLGDIASRHGNYTNTFNAPVSSAKNKEIAESAQQINSQTTIPYVKQTAEIRVGGAQTVLGIAQLKSAKDFFQWVIKSGNADLFERIKGLSLRDLDLSDYDHTWNITDVYNSRNPANDYSYGYVYPDIDYGQLGPGTIVVYYALYPAFYCKVLFNKIISDAGFTWSGDFSSNTLFPKMILPFAGKDFIHTQAWVTSKLFRANIATDSGGTFGTTIRYAGLDNDSTGGYFDNGNQVTLGAWSNFPTINAKFENNEGMTVTFFVEINFDVTTFYVGTPGQIDITIPGCPDAAYQLANITATGSYTAMLQGTVLLTTLSTDISIRFQCSLAQYSITSGVFYNEVSPNIEINSVVNIQSVLPDIKQTDFLLTIFNEFALLLQTNNLTNNINIFPFQSVIDNIPSAKDWRQKVDLSERPLKQYLFEDYAQENVFSYKTDEEDIYLSLEPTYGQGVINVANEFLPITKKVFESVFAPVKRIVTLNSTAVLAFVPKWTLNEDGVTYSNSINAVPRIAYVEMQNAENLVNIFGTVDRVTSPAVYFTDLEFTNLITEYYEPLERLLNKAKVVTALVRLNVADINQLDFEYPVLFTVDGEDAYFYINEVRQFKFNTKESTEVELVLLRP